MLKKQLHMLIILNAFSQPLLIHTSEHIQDTYTEDTVDSSEKPIFPNSAISEDFQCYSPQDDDENKFIEDYEQQPPSKKEKFLLLIAPYLIKLAPYYVYASKKLESIKLSAAHYYKALMHRKGA